MTTCPMCDEIRMEKGRSLFNPDKRIYHVNCDCGWAYRHSSWCSSKHEARSLWEGYMNQREYAARKESMT